MASMFQSRGLLHMHKDDMDSLPTSHGIRRKLRLLFREGHSLLVCARRGGGGSLKPAGLSEIKYDVNAELASS